MQGSIIIKRFSMPYVEKRLLPSHGTRLKEKDLEKELEGEEPSR